MLSISWTYMTCIYKIVLTWALWIMSIYSCICCCHCIVKYHCLNVTLWYSRGQHAILSNLPNIAWVWKIRPLSYLASICLHQWPQFCRRNVVTYHLERKYFYLIYANFVLKIDCWVLFHQLYKDHTAFQIYYGRITLLAVIFSNAQKGST